MSTDVRINRIKDASAGWLPGVDRDFIAAGLHPLVGVPAHEDRIVRDDVDVAEQGTGERAKVAKEDHKRFILAGDATFTVLNTRSQGRYTFKVSKSEDGKVWFVGVLTGPDNYSDYAYMGIVKDGAFFGTRKSRVSKDAPSYKAFAWLWGRLETGLPEFVEIWHEGSCCRCGRKLTTPESVKAGIGPVCADKGW